MLVLLRERLRTAGGELYTLSNVNYNQAIDDLILILPQNGCLNTEVVQLVWKNIPRWTKKYLFSVEETTAPPPQVVVGFTQKLSE